MASQPEPKNILLIRSATRVLNPILESLKKEFPDARITVLAPESAREAVENHPLIDAMLSAGDTQRMSVFGLNPGTFREMRRRAFDLAVSLYNIDHGMGYSNIDFLAWASGAGSVRGYNACGAFVELDGRGILKKWVLEKTSLVWIFLNAGATLVLFACITLGLLCEWVVRKLIAAPQVAPPRVKTDTPPAAVSRQAEPMSHPQSLPPEVPQKVLS